MDTHGRLLRETPLLSQEVILSEPQSGASLARGPRLRGVVAVLLQTVYSQNAAGLRCNHTQISAINKVCADMLSDECEFLQCAQTNLPALRQLEEARRGGPGLSGGRGKW